MKIDRIWQPQAQQGVFRELVEAMSRPGEVRDLAAWTDGAPAARAVLAALLDGETSLADPHDCLHESEWPLLQARRADAQSARYVLADGSRAPAFEPCVGKLESPELGATLVLAVQAVGAGALRVRLSGPGIEGNRELNVGGLHAGWLAQRALWVDGFPLGVDMILADAGRIAALPRTARLVVQEQP
jgi:alpha-D-ribose 1-methylphosphonate 5-triphosphate synthase subunit PhnH